jgi:hypothetical protein
MRHYLKEIVIENMDKAPEEVVDVVAKGKE